MFRAKITLISQLELHISLLIVIFADGIRL